MSAESEKFLSAVAAAMPSAPPERAREVALKAAEHVALHADGTLRVTGNARRLRLISTELSDALGRSALKRGGVTAQLAAIGATLDDDDGNGDTSLPSVDELNAFGRSGGGDAAE